MLPFQMEPSTGNSSTSKFVGFKGPAERGGPGGTPNSVAGGVPPKVPPRPEMSNPNMFSRRSIKPDIIGLAISPETNAAQRRPQRQSKLLPEKPTLTLMMPPSQQISQPGGLSFSQPVTQPSAVSRQSTATQFEEDEENADTGEAGDDAWRRKSVNQIWDYSTGRWTSIRAVDSNSQSQQPTVTATGEGSQWRPVQASNLTMSPNSYVKPLTLGSKVGSFSQPRRPDNFQRPQQQLEQLTIPASTGRVVTTTSSVYSQRGSLPAAESARHSTTRARRSYKQAGPYDHNSTGSLTSFETEDSIISPQEQEPKTAELSPVVESPASGRSPVSYPKIPGRLSGNTIRMVPPPPQPDFTKPLSAQAGAGKPWRQAEIAAQRERERVQALNQVQGQVGMQAFGSTHQRQRSRDSGYAAATTRLQMHPPPQYQQPPSSQRYPLPPLQTKLQNNIPPPPPPPPQPLADATGGWGIPPSTTQLTSALIPNPLSSHPSITFTRSSSTVSQYSQISNSSSLLAKRRGEQKAQTLSLKNEEEKKRGGKWRVLGREEIEEAKKVGWRPMLAGGRGEGKGEYEARTGQQFERTELPNTPGWVPKLTPTRRGDVLFLSVQ